MLQSRKALDLEAEVSRAMAYQMIKFGIAEKRLGWDAPPVETGAAGAFFFHTGDAFPKLGGADRADIPGGSAADNEEIGTS